MKRSGFVQIFILLAVVAVLAAVDVYLVSRQHPVPSRQVFSTQAECEQKTGTICHYEMCDYNCPGGFRKGWVRAFPSPYWSRYDGTSFLFDVPPGTQVQRDKNKILFFLQQGTSPLNIVIETDRVSNLSLEQLVAKTIDTYGVVSKEPLTFHGVPAVKATQLIHGPETMSAYFEYLAFIRGDTEYLISISSQQEIMGGDRSLVDRMLSSFTFVSSSPTATPTWQTYRNDWYGFEFKYPPDLLVTVAEADGEERTVILYEAAKPNVYYYRVDVSDRLTATTSTLEQWFKVNFGDQFPQPVRRSITFAGFSALQLTDPTPGCQRDLIAVLRDGILYTVSEPSCFGETQHAQTVGAINSTFKFIEPQATVSRMSSGPPTVQERCLDLLTEAAKFYPAYDISTGQSDSQFISVANECGKYLDKTCQTNNDCGSFPCYQGLCLVKPCNSDRVCPRFCGLHATPVPRFCTTIDVN